ncbi:MAG: hypothetical protein KGS61_16130, partial [Verrucomicrobia bacterium]|nr:hypothetical protein [Verrucomicrobiota bacterium]
MNQSRARVRVVLGLGLSWRLALVSLAAKSFYLAPNGHDTNPGTRAKPFATLERAREAVRELKAGSGLPSGGVTVFLRGGVYLRSATFDLAAEDSGSAGAPVVYGAARGEAVRILGGRPVTNWQPVTDRQVLDRLDPAARGQVWQADLKAAGITDYGRLTRRGFGGSDHPAQLELFFADRPMTLARWPNGEWATIAKPAAGPNAGRFAYTGDRPRRWTHAEDLWVHGYWTYDWADSYEKVKAIDLDHHEILTEPPHGVYGYKPGQRWYALNVLEELDSPGEYYVERRTGRLYFWPPGPLSSGNACVSLLESPLIRLQGVHDLVLRGLILEVTRGEGITVVNGTNVLIAGCTFRNIGT